MAEQPKPEEKKAETKEPEPSEFGHVCAGCQKPIKPGTNMVQDPHSKEWFHGEHYSMDERHQDPSEDQYECIACSKEFPEAEMHRDRDGETWCKPCWAAEHPRKPRAKKEKDPPLKHPAPKRNAPLAERIAAYTETPEYLYEQWPVAADGEIDLWGAIAVRNLPRPDSSDKAPAIVRKWDEAQKQAKTKEDAEIEDIITRGKFPEHAMNNIATCSKCKLPLSLEIYPADEGFKRCTCKTHENIEWAGTYLYNKIFASHFKEIKALLDKDAREKMNVLAEVLEDA